MRTWWVKTTAGCVAGKNLVSVGVTLGSRVQGSEPPAGLELSLVAPEISAAAWNFCVLSQAEHGFRSIVAMEPI